MYKPEPLTRRGSLRSLRSAPLLSTVLESTLSLTRIHPITSLELPGLDYAIETQSAIAVHHRELGTSLRSGLANVGQPLSRSGRSASIRQLGEYKRNIPAKRLSRKLKPHIVADTVKQYISRAQRTTKGSREQQPNMEFLRGVYAFMQVNYDYETSAATTTTFIAPLPTTSTTTVTTTIAGNHINNCKIASENSLITPKATAIVTKTKTTNITTKTATGTYEAKT